MRNRLLRKYLRMFRNVVYQRKEPRINVYCLKNIPPNRHDILPFVYTKMQFMLLLNYSRFYTYEQTTTFVHGIL